MYSSVHDQPPPALLPYSITSKLVVAPKPGPAAKQPLSLALFNSGHHLKQPSSFCSAPLSSPFSRPYSLPHTPQEPALESSTPPSRGCSRRAVLNVPMQRSPYSRDTTDISDQELRQILDSENISGLPAPYCLVPHYDAQPPLPQNPAWQMQPQSQSQQQQQQPRPMQAFPASVPTPSMIQQMAERNMAATGQQQHMQPSHQLQYPHPHPHPHHQQQSQSQAALQGSSSSQSSSGGHDVANPQSTAPSAPALSAVGDISRRRTRTTLTPYQLRVLFRVWERTQYPSGDLRSRLATNLMMTPRNVQIWFQNQRQKTKERAEMRRRTHSPSLHAVVMANAGMPPQPHPVQLAQRQPPLHHQHQLQPQPHLQPYGQPPSPARLAEHAARDVHASAISIPGRSPPESPFRYTHGPPPAPPAVHASSHHYHHDHRPHAAPPTGDDGAVAQTGPPVPSAYSMLTPPALYPHVFSQQHPPPGSPSLQPSAHAYQQQPQPQHQLQLQPHPHPHPLAHPLAQSSSAVRHPYHHHQHLHHQRHSSQPHILDNPPYMRPPSSALTQPFHQSSSSSLQDSPKQRPVYSAAQKQGAMHAHEPASEGMQPMRPHHQQRVQTPLNTYHNIPTPSTPTFSGDQSRQPQSPSPLASRQQQSSPPLLSYMSTLTVASTSASGGASLTPQTLREHPVSRRTRLTDILNPIGSDAASTASSADGTGDSTGTKLGTASSQLGPLPSLGSVLADVQSETQSEAPALVTTSAGSESVSASAATSTEKWRPW
ncbi:hypothetical protein GGI07_000017 [Coemansia sp. Benny D115]|nr:hypothetical protein GGI07_000017 [Coemansia sp. Benny D115]